MLHGDLRTSGEDALRRLGAKILMHELENKKEIMIHNHTDEAYINFKLIYIS